MDTSESKTLDDILEIVTFLKDSAVTRQEFKEELGAVRQEFKEELGAVRQEFRDEIQGVKQEILTHIDGFVVLHQKLDTELVALQAKYERLDNHVQRIAAHVQMTLQ